MKQTMILLAMTIGFTLGNFVAFKGNETAKNSYEDFVRDIQSWQAQNREFEEPSEFHKQAEELPLSSDPNLELHN